MIDDPSAATPGFQHTIAADSPRLVIRPLIDRTRSLDVTDVVAHAIAEHLGRVFGGNAVLNTLEAQRTLHEALWELRLRDPAL